MDAELIEIKELEKKLTKLKAIRREKETESDSSLRDIIDKCISKVFGGIDTSFKCKETDYVWSRWQTWALLRDHTDYGVTEMGAMYGNRNHSTVIWGLTKHEDMLFIQDPDYVNLWETVTALFEDATKPIVGV